MTPLIRIIHTLGGCGGTILSRCLGVLPRVVLFSEINPLAAKLFETFDPIYQDRHWHHLLETPDLERFGAVDLREMAAFRALIGRFQERADALGKYLILRDYNYVEFVGVPFLENPPRRRMMAKALAQSVPLSALAFIRHPVDQWSSLCKHEKVRGVLLPRFFLEAYLAFLDDLGDVPLFRYERFVGEPRTELRRMCDVLSLEFDPAFEHKFSSYDQVTGDFTRHHERSIAPAPKRLIAAADLAAFRGDPNYERVLERTGYSDDLWERGRRDDVG